MNVQMYIHPGTHKLKGGSWRICGPKGVKNILVVCFSLSSHCPESWGFSYLFCHAPDVDTVMGTAWQVEYLNLKLFWPKNRKGESQGTRKYQENFGEWGTKKCKIIEFFVNWWPLSNLNILIQGKREIDKMGLQTLIQWHASYKKLTSNAMI